MRRSNSRSVQSSGWASTARLKSSARGMRASVAPAAPGPRVRRLATHDRRPTARAVTATILEAMPATDTENAAVASLAAEHEALTRSCGLVDRSERGKLALTGAGAIEFLNGQVTNELAGLRAGEGRYAAFLTHKGKMLGDLRILAVGEAGAAPRELQLDTERVALQALFDMISRFKVGYEVQLHKRTLERGLLSLIGPESASVAGATRLGRAEHETAALQLEGTGCLT